MDLLMLGFSQLSYERTGTILLTVLLDTGCELVMFLSGSVEYCLNYIDAFTTKATLFFDLLKRNALWEWTEQGKDAVVKIKQASLHPPNPQAALEPRTIEAEPRTENREVKPIMGPGGFSSGKSGIATEDPLKPEAEVTVVPSVSAAQRLQK
eukprot:g29674.t1